ncbi:MAG: glycosyltransferase [Candidatus Helarchaeota archaeon]
MKKSRVIMYGLPIVIYFIVLHILFPSWLNAPIKQGIDSLFTDFTANWILIFPFVGLVVLAGVICFYGIHFLASFSSGYKTKELSYPEISIIIASKDERPLLQRTLNSIINSEYPQENLQIIIVTSNSTDDSTEFCKKFAKKHSNIDIEILSDPLSIKGKPAALNYGLKYVKHDICVFYDSGIIIKPKTLAYLIEPIQRNKSDVTIGSVLVENWKKNKWTRGAALDYCFSAGGNIFFEVKNKLGSSAYLFGRNISIKTKLLQDLGNFKEDSLTEDLYLSVLLNLNEKKILFVPEAKAYDLAPITWSAIKKQRSRWIGGYIGDMPQLMQMKKGNKDGQSIVISRNLSMLLLHHVDDWIFIVAGFIVLYTIMGFYYILSWSITIFIFFAGYLINAVRKYGDSHFSLFLGLPICAYIHLFMLKLQFSLPKEINWEKTPMILEKSSEEIEALIPT